MERNNFIAYGGIQLHLYHCIGWNDGIQLYLLWEFHFYLIHLYGLEFRYIQRNTTMLNGIHLHGMEFTCIESSAFTLNGIQMQAIELNGHIMPMAGALLIDRLELTNIACN